MAVINARPIVFFLVLAGVGSAPLRGQSLADVAKMEEERRKTVSKPAKVYTNKDLTAPRSGAPPSSGTGAADSPRAAADADQGAKDKEVKSNDPAKVQAYWSGRVKKVQDKLDRDQTYVEALQTRINSLTADFVNRDDPAQRMALERDRQKAVAELGRLQQDIVDGKKALADIEEEARRAGVPPGWLR